ncbi:MAG: hypothetical protein FJ112_10260 [Deltaproteobacteria bacterium]|nr:hypothetical protein [Deltaproteobacteria bacterium]
MKKLILNSLVTLLLLSCSSSPQTSKEAKEHIEKNFNEKIGSATKTDLIESYGNPEWCQVEDSGNETCRFYKKIGTKWIGEKKQKDKRPVETGDQVIVSFDKDGILRSFKASAQR